ncbi:hypothetical protein CYR23_16510 [Chimaeribacter arupi]|nr:hypothetical protein CYR23_16510 [Chimaeribacter arupi]
MSTYEKVFDRCQGSSLPLELYAWNALTSAAFLAPLHLCEVVIRNAVADALEAQYGDRWPWSPGFERSLPDPVMGYSQRKDLFSARRNQQTTGKVIPELKFIFWQKLFTRRNDERLWNRYLRVVFPNSDSALAVSQQRQVIYDDLERVRKLRNRIAHHEPIFSRELLADYKVIKQLIHLRCHVTAEWMDKHQQVLSLLNDSPMSE